MRLEAPQRDDDTILLGDEKITGSVGDARNRQVCRLQQPDHRVAVGAGGSAYRNVGPSHRSLAIRHKEFRDNYAKHSLTCHRHRHAVNCATGKFAAAQTEASGE
jgi:hypothetical protein